MKRPGARCKGVHVKLDRDVHKRFKMKLLEHGVSMQEAFEAFARMVADGNLSANRLIDTHMRVKLRKELTEMGMTPLPHRRTPRCVSELSDVGIYNLINEGDDDAGRDDDEHADA